MASLLDWLGDRLKDVGNGIGGAANEVGKTVSQAFTPQQPQQRPQVRPQQAPQKPNQFNTGVGSITVPKISVPKINVAPPQAPPQNNPQPVTPQPMQVPKAPFADTQQVMQAINAAAPQKPRNFFQDIGDLTAAANETFLGGGKPSPLSSDANRNSPAFKAGQAIGTGEQVATDIATTAIPGAFAEKLIRGVPLITNGLKSANVAARLGSTVAPVVGGGVVSSAANQLKNPEQNAGENFATNAAFDVGSALLGPTASAAGRLFRNPAVRGAAETTVRQVPTPPRVATRTVDSLESASVPRQTANPELKQTQKLLPPQPRQSLEPTSLAIAPKLGIEDSRLLQSEPALPTRQTNIQNPLQDSPVIPNLSKPQLPSFDTKKTGLLDKAFRSTRSIIERQGESGKTLAGGLRAARDTQEMYLGDLQKAMPTVTQIAKKGKNALTNKDFENFVDATQGLAPPKNAKISQAVNEWQATHPGIRDRAVQAGLDVGDLGPNYYPHFIDYEKVFKDRNTYNEAINHLVKTGQAKTPEEAIQLLTYAKDVSRNRQFGNLEASRLVDLPFYDKTPNSLISYLNGSAKRIAQTETFGQKDEKALKLIAQIGKEGGDTEAAKNAYDIAVGAKQYNPTSEAVSSNIRKYITTTRLGLGALTNTSQSVNTGIVTGHLRTMGAMLKQLNPQTRSFVQDTGVISDALLSDLRTQKGVESFSQKVLGKAINKITAPGFGAVEKFNRSVAATAGRDYALRLAQKGDERTLRKLGVTGDIANRSLNEAQQIQAARRIVEKTQFKVDPQDLPGWTDSPGGKLVSQFRTFSYMQGKFFSNEVLKPLAKGNVLPLGRVLAAIPLGYALYETRRSIDGRPEEEDKTKVALQSFSKIGGAGLALDIYQGLNPVGSKYLPSDRRVTMAAGAVGGPTVGQGASLVGGLSEAIQQKNIPTDESRLDGKVAVKNAEGDKYNDLTPISRFGMSQVPVIGTATANRVLPYKALSDADNGKSDSVASGVKSDNATMKSLAEEKKQQAKDLEKAIGKDDLAIYNLSKKDQKKLIERGGLDQTTLTAINKAVDTKKREFGMDVTNTNKTYADKYAALQKDFDENGSNWSPIEKIKKQKDLNTLAVQKEFDNDTVDLYGLSKQDVFDYVSKDKNGKKLVDDIVAYGDALVKAGVTKTNKFKDKYGNISLNDGRKKAGGKGKKSKGSAKAMILPKTSVPKTATPPSFGGKGAVASASYKQIPLRRYSGRSNAPKPPKGVKANKIA